MTWVVGIGIFLLLFFMFPKHVLALIALCLVIAGAIWAYFYIENLSKESKNARIEISAKYDPSCDKKYPIRITIQNTSADKINKIYFNLKAYRSGYSDYVYSDSYKSHDRIIEPKYSTSSCWSLSSYSWHNGNKAKSAPNLRWEAKISSVTWAD